ncbi:hypothetical protein K450DRAFT_249439 [Umbelopsis ramanniana AG]|uniref:Secreted protein n=1 Tax=Umbelopsis ramanniana AG TaxID=1314678 RepID=A0AAD5HCX9_UMBRA|nr:uncharacterized protein K450DRAFT_249439 [Umbelopsis ramanniana AG]KAI8577996.1 hypothetical protein K450DRAFT_249439 [Umbelopsis ramanniana AG]
MSFLLVAFWTGFSFHSLTSSIHIRLFGHITLADFFVSPRSSRLPVSTRVRVLQDLLGGIGWYVECRVEWLL